MSLSRKSNISLAKIFRSSCSHVQHFFAKLSWVAKLLIASVLCAALAIVGLHFTDQTEKTAKEKAEEKQDIQRKEEAAYSWALQQTLLSLTPNSATGGEKGQRMQEALKRARAALELEPSTAALTGTKVKVEGSRKIKNLNQAKRGKTDAGNSRFLLQTDLLQANLVTIMGRGSAALLIISILCLLALIVIPFAKNLFQIGEENASDALKPEGGRKESGGRTTLPPNIIMPRDERPPDSARSAPPTVSVGLPPVVRQALIPLVLSSGVIVGIGAILVNASGRELSVTSDVRSPNVGLNVGDFAIAVQPGRIDVPAANIIPSNPRLLAEIPKIEVHLPVDDAQQKVVAELTLLASKLQEYDRSLELRMKEQQDEILRLSRSNEGLKTELAIRPTKQSVEDLARQVEQQNELKSRLEEVLDANHQSLAATKKTLDETLPPLVKVSAERQYGDRVTARQVTRHLNAQNEHLFNQIFRPGFIRKNCETTKRSPMSLGDFRPARTRGCTVRYSAGIDRPWTVNFQRQQ